MELTAFAEFAVILGIAAFLGIIFTRLRQPAILGYIFTGLIVGPLTPAFHPDIEPLELFSKIGITLLLFILGLELNINELRNLGKVALATGIGQIIFTTVIGMLIAKLLGFDMAASLYIAIALTFSSTIIIVKLLTQTNKLETLSGRISVGFLLVQDFAAILILILLGSLGTIKGGGVGEIAIDLVVTLGIAILVGLSVYLFTRFILNPLLDHVRKDKEILFITVVAWALITAASLAGLGFSVEIGGLLAGIALANRFESLQLESWTRPLRDFFLILFFVLLGLEIEVSSISSAIVPALIFSAFVLIGNPLIVMVIMGILGYSSKVSFYTSLAVAQISEFSLILISFGVNELNQINNEILTVITLVGGITMTVSTYFIYYGESIYQVFHKFLKVFEFGKHNLKDETPTEPGYEIILFGCHRMGRKVLDALNDLKSKILVIDLDPQTVDEIRNKGFNTLYGDISDTYLYSIFKIKDARTIISTVPVLKENLRLINYFKDIDPKPVFLIVANNDTDASQLYENGADFVVYPHMLGGELLTSIVRKGKLTTDIVAMRNLHLGILGD